MSRLFVVRSMHFEYMKFLRYQGAMNYVEYPEDGCECNLLKGIVYQSLRIYCIFPRNFIMRVS